MKTASVTELKARLSHYLGFVRRGNEVQILQRGVPIARLVGCQVSASRVDKDRIERLVRAGILRRGNANLGWILNEAPIAVPNGQLARAIQDERDDRL